jgi:hypothetical protein
MDANQTLMTTDNLVDWLSNGIEMGLSIVQARHAGQAEEGSLIGEMCDLFPSEFGDQGFTVTREAMQEAFTAVCDDPYSKQFLWPLVKK